jgi:hypothetical protein
MTTTVAETEKELTRVSLALRAATRAAERLSLELAASKAENAQLQQLRRELAKVWRELAKVSDLVGAIRAI